MTTHSSFRASLSASLGSAPSHGPRSRWRWDVTVSVAAAAPLLLGALALGGCDNRVLYQPEEPATVCWYQGEQLAVGEQVSMDDGCNVCQCAENGLACSMLDCTEVCVDSEGSPHTVGTSWDPCPSCECATACSCLAGGSIVCTEEPCNNAGCEHEGEWYAPGESYETFDDTCTCQTDGTFDCAWTEDPVTVCVDELGEHDVGDSWELCPDCQCTNVCTCFDDGSIACTDDPQCEQAS